MGAFQIHLALAVPRSRCKSPVVLGLLCVWLLGCVFGAHSAFAATTTGDNAQTAVKRWLQRDARPLGSALNAKVKNVVPFQDEKGTTIYHVVSLDPSGFVVVAAEKESGVSSLGEPS